MKDPERLYFPPEIATEIGTSGMAIRAMKRRGCPFLGRKTTIKWVREFIAKEAGAIPSVRERIARRPRSTVNTPHAPGA